MVDNTKRSENARIAALAAQADRREAHKQTVAERRRSEIIKDFPGTQFIARVEPTKFRFDAFGNVEVLLVVPMVYRAEALSLIDSQGVPLSVDIQRWQRYEEAHSIEAVGNDR